MLVASDRGTRSNVLLRTMALYSSLIESRHLLSFKACAIFAGSNSEIIAARPYFRFGLLILFLDRVVIACVLLDCVAGAMELVISDVVDVVGGVVDGVGDEGSETGVSAADVGAKEPATG